MKCLSSISNSDMSKHLLPALLFILLLVVAQILIARYVFNWDDQVMTIDAAVREKADILYFGDSVIRDSPATESNHKSIAEFLADATGTSVADLSQGAEDAKLFSAMTEHIVNSGAKPVALIIPVNLRSFSPEWNRRPGYQFERQKFLLTEPAFLGYFFQPLAVFHAFKIPAVTQEEFLNSPVRYATTTVGTVADFENAEKFKMVTAENRREKYLYFYMGSIEENNEEFLALKETLRKAKEAGIPAYVYITPIDYKGGVASIGKDFLTQVTNNINMVCSAVASLTVPCLNLAFTLGSGNFSAVGYPGEHLYAEGRQYVAEQLRSHFFK